MFVKNTPLCVSFSTILSGFEHVIKHGLSCLIYFHVCPTVIIHFKTLLHTINLKPILSSCAQQGLTATMQRQDSSVLKYTHRGSQTYHCVTPDTYWTILRLTCLVPLPRFIVFQWCREETEYALLMVRSRPGHPHSPRSKQSGETGGACRRRGREKLAIT